MLKRARLLCYLVVCVSRAVLSVVLGARSVRFVGWADWVDCRCFLSFVFLGVAKRLELSPCNTIPPPGNQLALSRPCRAIFSRSSSRRIGKTGPSVLLR